MWQTGRRAAWQELDIVISFHIYVHVTTGSRGSRSASKVLQGASISDGEDLSDQHTKADSGCALLGRTLL